MEVLELKSYGKINWILDVVRKRPDGYHDIETIFQRISLHDDVTLIKQKKDITIECNYPQVPLDERNLAYKSAEFLLEKYGIDEGLKIKINKRIPVSRGFGGGSSNSAVTLLGIKELFDLSVSKKRLSKTAASIGADIPFFLQDKPCFATGMGEILKPLRELPEFELIIVVPKVEFSEDFKKTAWAYKRVDEIEIQHPDTKKMLKYFKSGNWEEFIKNLSNVFEYVMFEEFPIIRLVRDKLLSFGCKNALLCGAGPGVFGIVEESLKRDIYNKMQTYGDVFLSKTI